MMIQCLIERDGDTTITRGGVNYVFRQNKQGHAVCEVQNDDHARIFLRMGPKVYRPYGTPSETHALRLKMIDAPSETQEIDDDGDVFEEPVAIIEGRSGDTPSTAKVGPQVELFDEVESAEEALAQLPDEETDEAAEAETDEVTTSEAAGDDTLVRSVAMRLLTAGGKKHVVAEELSKQFGLSADEARRIVHEARK